MRKLALLAALVVGLLSTGSANERPMVGMEIGLPDGSTRKLAITDGTMVPMDVSQAGRFGFRPSVDPVAGQWVTIGVFALNGDARSELGKVKVFIGEKAVSSQTSPSFTVRVTKLE